MHYKREYYSAEISDFIITPEQTILGVLVSNSDFSVETTQRDAWIAQIKILKSSLKSYSGSIYFEYSVPRMGKRIDVLVIVNSVIIILEFKVGESTYNNYAIDQVWDYALDLKNFHETSHECYIAPVLIATKAETLEVVISTSLQNDKVLFPVKCNTEMIDDVLKNIIDFTSDDLAINRINWQTGRYQPTPTIIEAATALYGGHGVENISRSDANAKNLSLTSQSIANVIKHTRDNSRKAICFVTGVPGAGKTLVGLNIATKHIDKNSDLYSVFLSGNGPLVAILREALARDKVTRYKISGKKIKKSEALSEVKLFIQNVHNFRDECLIDKDRPPIEHVAIFDEAQRAWDLQQTSNFMLRKKNTPNFQMSEPEYLISCMDRHDDWAVIVCLVGGGQEINTGEAGIKEWFESLKRSFESWDIYVSDKLIDSEYGVTSELNDVKKREQVAVDNDLHLSVSMRSFRAENVSLLVKKIIDRDADGAKEVFNQINSKYPIVITRDLSTAKKWLKMRARGTERYGIVVSSQAVRLKPYAIDVKVPVDPIHWFLDNKDDVRSSYYLEDVVTEFQIQGLEIDWACVTWDADLRVGKNGWEYYSFVGNRWNNIRKVERQKYLENAYRVLLTRARQGMVIFIPSGDPSDQTRNSEYYNPIYDYLKQIGFMEI